MVIDKKQDRLKSAAKIAMVILLLNVVAKLAMVYQTRYVLITPLVPESIIWEVNKQFVFLAFISAIASVVGMLLYFFDKYLLIIIMVALVLVAEMFV